MPEREVLLFDPITERGDLPLGDRFRMLDRRVQDAEVVVIRSSAADTARVMKDDRVLRSVIGSRVLMHLGRSYDRSDPGPHLVSIGPVEIPADEAWIHELRQAELLALLYRTQCIFEEDNHHYLLPSGWHAERFVRFGNACSSLPDVRRVADWVLGSVDQRCDLLADTGTILPILQEVQRHCNAIFGWATRIDALAGYPSAESIAGGVEDLGSERNGRRVLFVVSVNSSGGALARFGVRIDEGRGDAAIVMCDTSPTERDPSRALVHLPSQRWSPGPDGRCESCGSPAQVVVNPATYEAVASHQLDLRPITPSMAAESASTFELLSHLDALHVHYTSERGSHYAVWIDSPRLLKDESEVSQFQALIASKGQFDTVLIPTGPAADRLAEIASKVMDCAPQVIDVGNPLPQETVTQIQRAENVLIVDDALVTGTTLSRLRRMVYRAGQMVGRSPEATATVLVSRPSSGSDLTAVRRPYRTASGVQLHSLHDVMMPSPRRCPFCIERRLLRRWLVALGQESQYIVLERLAVLDSEIAARMFLGSSSDGPDLVTAGSFFGTLSEKAGFVAAASTAHRALDVIGPKIRSSGAATIDLCAAFDAYYDPCLLVGILRTCEKEEVRFAATDGAIAAGYARLHGVGDAIPDAVRCEVVWAALREVIPCDGAAALLNDVQSRDAIFLRELLHLRGAHVL